MNRLYDMNDTLVSFKNNLQRRKSITENFYAKPHVMAATVINKPQRETSNPSNSVNHIDTKCESSTISQPKLANVQTQHIRNDPLHFDLLTKENFYYAHLCNRSIDELPNVSIDDIKQLKLINIYTMQDLLGRFLIHDNADDFYSFLINTFRLSEKNASSITDLFDQWIKHNIDGTGGG